MRKLKGYPAARYKEAFALITAFCPNRSVSRRAKMARKFFDRVRVLDPARDWKLHNELTGLGLRRRLLRKIVAGTKHRVELRGGLSHELAHFFRFGKNDLLTSNAISGYLSSRGKATKRRPGFYDPWLADAEAILKGPKWLKNPRYEHDQDVDLGHAGTSIDVIGNYLGQFAMFKERQWKKPASGLFLLREVCNGLPVKNAIEGIGSGKLDKEIKAFEKNYLASLFPKK